MNLPDHIEALVNDLRKAADAIEQGFSLENASWGFEYDVVPDEAGGAPFRGAATFRCNIKFRGPV